MNARLLKERKLTIKSPSSVYISQQFLLRRVKKPLSLKTKKVNILRGFIKIGYIDV